MKGIELEMLFNQIAKFQQMCTDEARYIVPEGPSCCIILHHGYITAPLSRLVKIKLKLGINSSSTLALDEGNRVHLLPVEQGRERRRQKTAETS